MIFKQNSLKNSIFINTLELLIQLTKRICLVSKFLKKKNKNTWKRRTIGKILINLQTIKLNCECKYKYKYKYKQQKPIGAKKKKRNPIIFFFFSLHFILLGTDNLIKTIFRIHFAFFYVTYTHTHTHSQLVITFVFIDRIEIFILLSCLVQSSQFLCSH